MTRDTEPVLAAGVYAALATPRRSGSIEPDAAVLLEYVDAIIQAGVDGLVLFGSTGEFVHFDTQERARVVALAIRRSKVPVLVNVSHSTLAGAVQLAENAVDAGAAGLLIMPPYFYRYSDDTIFQFYDEFLRLLDDKVPLYLYNAPAFTNQISPELCERLIRTGAFAGVKDSSTGPTLFQSLVELKKEIPFQLLVGTESAFVSGLRAGADGVVSGIAAAIPELLVCGYRAFRNNHPEQLETVSVRLNEFLAQIDKFPAAVAIKQAAVARGWGFNQLAVPVDEDLAAEIIAFQNWARLWIPAALAQCEPAPMRT
jgi:dihydrodipicolinate synthase/N-acetylneuraminate lyase